MGVTASIGRIGRIFASSETHKMPCVFIDYASITTFGFLEIFGPVWNQAPPLSVQGALLGLWAKPDREHVLCRSNVPPDRQIPLRRIGI
jgi:hypothetical protein